MKYVVLLLLFRELFSFILTAGYYLLSHVPTPATLRRSLHGMQFVRSASKTSDTTFERHNSTSGLCRWHFDNTYSILTWLHVHTTQTKNSNTSVLHVSTPPIPYSGSTTPRFRTLIRIQYIIYYTLKSSLLITVCETHMVYNNCKNNVIYYELLV